MGHNSVAIGDSALYSMSNPNGTTAIGSKALYSVVAANYNTAVGSEALYAVKVGVGNTAVGYDALFYNNDSYNTAVGYKALINTLGYYNTSIGSLADVSSTNLFNATAVGYNAKVNASNKVRIGNENVTVVESAAGSWTTSDGRFKKNIKENVKGLEFIKLLKPVTYNFDTKKFSEFLMQNYPDSLKRERIAEMNRDVSEKASNIMQSGFVAQDVAEAVRKSGYDFNGVHAPDSPTDNWSLSYEKLVVPLIKAVQELSKMNDEKDSEITSLEARLEKLEAILKTNSSTTILSSVVLDQNIPNPFTKSTTIGYSLPQSFTSAQIKITDINGKTLKTVNISGSGKGTLNVEASILSSGAYNYSLYANGKLVSTKQMERLK
ncbi:MAG: tail fiber domain-containing protein [Ginsengibacter sp.]